MGELRTAATVAKYSAAATLGSLFVSSGLRTFLQVTGSGPHLVQPELHQAQGRAGSSSRSSGGRYCSSRSSTCTRS